MVWLPAAGNEGACARWYLTSTSSQRTEEDPYWSLHWWAALYSTPGGADCISSSFLTGGSSKHQPQPRLWTTWQKHTRCWKYTGQGLSVTYNLGYHSITVTTFSFYIIIWRNVLASFNTGVVFIDVSFYFLQSILNLTQCHKHHKIWQIESYKWSGE